MKKTINPLSATFYSNSGKLIRGNVFMKIEIKDGKLSISGVEAPTIGGDCRGSCGQIYKPLAEYDQPKLKPGWTPELYAKFIAIWERWHLNDVRPNCEHQHGGIWETKDVELVEYKLTNEAISQQSAIKEATESGLKETGTAKLSKTDRVIYALEYSFKLPAEQELSTTIKPFYEDAGHETKNTGWLDQFEHPDGILSRPCPICGYKYGTAWKFEALPMDVINFLKSLPETETRPAWV